MRTVCDDCGVVQEVGTTVGGKLGSVAMIAVLGPTVRKITGSRLLAAVSALFAAAIGAFLGRKIIDERLLPACRSCQGALRAVAALV